VFDHQWSAPLELDLGPSAARSAAALQNKSEFSGLPLRTYRDLFQHPRPPLDLLRLVKEFGKAQQAPSEAALPREIALALYYTSILVARVRLGERISSLSDAALRQATDWLLAQDWVDESTRELFRLGRAHLTSGGVTAANGDGP